MISKKAVLFMFVSLYSNNTLSDIALTQQEQSDINVNREIFLNAVTTQPSLVFEPTKQFDLRRVDLRGLNLMNAIITNVDLSDADLSGVNIMAAKLTNINFTNANLSEIKANNTRFWQCTLTNANFTQAFMPGVQIIGKPDSFVSAQNLNAQGANISNGALLQYVNLSGANLSGCNLHGSALYNIIVDDKTSFRGATDLSMAQLDNWSGYHGTLLSWLQHQVASSKLLADTSINGANSGITQN